MRDVTWSGQKRNSPCLISTHTSHAGRDGSPAMRGSTAMHFYSHVPCGTWRSRRERRRQKDDFYSHVPCGTWRPAEHHQADCQAFLLTRPMRDVTEGSRTWERERSFLLTRPMRDVTNMPRMCMKKYMISTHTSHAGRDICSCPVHAPNSISTHTSHAGRDPEWPGFSDAF